MMADDKYDQRPSDVVNKEQPSSRHCACALNGSRQDCCPRIERTNIGGSVFSQNKSTPRLLGFYLARLNMQTLNMAVQDTKTLTLPDGLMAEVERIAQAQQRTVNEVFKEAVEHYLNRREFKEVLSFGELHSRSRGLTPADVALAIARAREERGR